MKVVAGVDLGGTAVNYTFLTGAEQFLIECLCEYPARSREGPRVCLRQIVEGLTMAADRAGVALSDIVVVGSGYAGPGQRRGRAQRHRLHQLRACGLGGLRHSSRTRGQAAGHAGDLPERRQRGALWGHFNIFGAKNTATSVSASHRHRPGRRRDHRRARW